MKYLVQLCEAYLNSPLIWFLVFSIVGGLYYWRHMSADNAILKAVAVSVGVSLLLVAFSFLVSLAFAIMNSKWPKSLNLEFLFAVKTRTKNLHKMYLNRRKITINALILNKLARKIHANNISGFIFKLQILVFSFQREREFNNLSTV